MVNTQGWPATPTYPEYQTLLGMARRADAGFVNPSDVYPGGRFDQIEQRHGDDWCGIVTGRWPWPGWRRLTHLECQVLAAADAAGIDPPEPAWMVEAKAERAARAAAELARLAAAAARWQELHDRDVAAWAAVAAAAVVQFSIFLNPTARPRHGFRDQIGHAVPDVDCYSGTQAVRTHHAGRALCESPNRNRPLRLEDSPSPDAPVTCVSCLSWAAKVRTAP